jgi:hypothetical protein
MNLKNEINKCFSCNLKFLIAALLAVAAAAPRAIYEQPAITIVNQSDARNSDGSSKWR